MKEKNKIKLIDIILIIVLIIALSVVFSGFKKNNFNDFSKAELYANKSEFKRDNKVKYSKMDSYKIESEEFNDAMIHKKIEVTPNTAYKLTCMVKTENIITENAVSNGGVLICVADTVEQSKALTGTHDWEKLEFLFNSKNRTSIDIGFRLGGNEDNAKGTVWFSDFTLESGTISEDNNWNMACFILENIDVKVDNVNVNLTMSDNDIETVKDNMERFKNTFNGLSNDKINIKYDIYKVQEPLKTLSYDEENGYYVSPKDVEGLINDVITKKEYDHIFIVVRFGNEFNRNQIKVRDWIGLGGMDYYGIGFSNIRLPDSNSSYLYTYNPERNTFPEEVWVHEFLHTLERNQKELGYYVPALHDNEKYGYYNQRLVGLYDWYKDYMRKNIEDKEALQKIGLIDKVYITKPIHPSNFSYTLDQTSKVFSEPQNVFQEFAAVFKSIGRALKI